MPRTSWIHSSWHKQGRSFNDFFGVQEQQRNHRLMLEEHTGRVKCSQYITLIVRFYSFSCQMVILFLKSSKCLAEDCFQHWIMIIQTNSTAFAADFDSSHLGLPGPLQLPLAVGLFVVQGQRLPTGGWWRSQAGAVTHGEAQRDKDPRGREAVQEGRGQPVVLQPLVLVDIADLEGPYELPFVIQDADLIPLRKMERVTWRSTDGRVPRSLTSQSLHSAVNTREFGCLLSRGLYFLLTLLKLLLQEHMSLSKQHTGTGATIWRVPCM